MAGDDKERGHLRDVPATPNATTPANAPKKDPDFKVRPAKVVQCCFVGTNSLAISHMRSLAMKAHKLLIQHNMELRVLGMPTGIEKAPFYIDINDFNGSEAGAEAKLQAQIKALSIPKKHIPVIFVNSSAPGNQTVGATYPSGMPERCPDRSAERWIICYTNKNAADDVTLLHEIGHAAGQSPHDGFDESKKDGRYSIMVTPGDMTPAQAAKPEYYRQTMDAGLCTDISNADFSVLVKDTTLQRLA